MIGNQSGNNKKSNGWQQGVGETIPRPSGVAKHIKSTQKRCRKVTHMWHTSNCLFALECVTCVSPWSHYLHTIRQPFQDLSGSKATNVAKCRNHKIGFWKLRLRVFREKTPTSLNCKPSSEHTSIQAGWPTHHCVKLAFRWRHIFFEVYALHFLGMRAHT